jgi:hypothetical protein
MNGPDGVEHGHEGLVEPGDATRHDGEITRLIRVKVQVDCVDGLVHEHLIIFTCR